MANNIGKITQIIGAVLDIKFTEGNLPEINDAIKVPTRDGKELVVEVSQHLGDDIVDVSPWDLQTDSYVEWMRSLQVLRSAFL